MDKDGGLWSLRPEFESPPGYHRSGGQNTVLGVVGAVSAEEPLGVAEGLHVEDKVCIT